MQDLRACLTPKPQEAIWLVSSSTLSGGCRKCARNWKTREQPVAAAGEDKRCDAQVDLHVAGKSVTVLIEAKKTLYPRDVRQALWQLKEFSRKWPPKGPKSRQHVPMLVAEAISPGAKQLLRDEGVGYYDSGGSLFLPGDGVYLYIDKPPAKSLSKSMR